MFHGAHHFGIPVNLLFLHSVLLTFWESTRYQWMEQNSVLAKLKIWLYATSWKYFLDLLKAVSDSGIFVCWELLLMLGSLTMWLKEVGYSQRPCLHKQRKKHQVEKARNRAHLEPGFSLWVFCLQRLGAQLQSQGWWGSRRELATAELLERHKHSFPRPSWESIALQHLLISTFAKGHKRIMMVFLNKGFELLCLLPQSR